MRKLVLARAATTVAVLAATLSMAAPAGATILPSNACDLGSQVVDSTTEGVHVKAYTLAPSANETDVCVRIEQLPAGTGYGGKFTVTTSSPGIGNVPNPTPDANVAACQAAGNLVPGTHPIAGGGIAGTPYLLDAYLSGSSLSICLGAGADVTQRVLVPITVPTLDPGVQLHLLGDPGTPSI